MTVLRISVRSSFSGASLGELSIESSLTVGRLRDRVQEDLNIPYCQLLVGEVLLANDEAILSEVGVVDKCDVGVVRLVLPPGDYNACFESSPDSDGSFQSDWYTDATVSAFFEADGVDSFCELSLEEMRQTQIRTHRFECDVSPASEGGFLLRVTSADCILLDQCQVDASSTRMPELVGQYFTGFVVNNGRRIVLDLSKQEGFGPSCSLDRI